MSLGSRAALVGTIVADHRTNDRKGTRSQRQQAEVERLRAAKAAAYDERSRLVAVLARLYPSGVQRTAIDDVDGEWHGCVYIDLPTGQASWHFQGDQARHFVDLPPYEGSWDGHTTAEKYERLAGTMTPSTECATLRARLELVESALRDLLATAGAKSGTEERAAQQRGREILGLIDGDKPER